MARTNIMHFLNQFFAGVGGEDKADVPLECCEGPVGPGKRLQALLGDSVKIAVTAYCGDNYFSENTDEVLKRLLEIAKDSGVQMVVAGPAFAAGRYGFACVEACHYLSTSLGLNSVSAMYIENPGVDGYRKYKDKKVFILPTSDATAGMEDALSRMAKFISKLAADLPIGSASEEGYIPRRIRVDADASKSAADRAVDMILDKVAGRPFETEIPVEIIEKVPVPAPIVNIKNACLALVSTTGVIRAGNPDGFKMVRNTQYRKYSIDKLDSMKDTGWDVIHAGYNNAFMHGNPNYGVPLDASRELEREGAFGKLFSNFYGTTGVGALILAMQAIGKEIAADLQAGGVDGVLLVST